MKKIIIPEGKELFIEHGKYLFKGPCEVSENILVRKTVPLDFTDGTEWQWTNEDGTTESPESIPEPIQSEAATLDTVKNDSKQTKKKPKRKTPKKEVIQNDTNEQASTERATSESEDQEKTLQDNTGNENREVPVVGDLQ